LRWVRLFCGWLRDDADEQALGADPLADLAARGYAARDFKRFLKSERALEPASVNLALAAVDHLYRQLGRANVRRESLPVAAPRALSRDEQRRLLRAAKRAGRAPDGEPALFLSLKGTRISPRAADAAIRRVAGDAGLELSAHVLRHTGNTRYIAHALETLERQGHTLRDDDVRHIHPVHHEHINPFGHYRFDTRREPTEGRLRPLRATTYISRETPATNATATNA